jgi:hypothetical protein
MRKQLKQSVQATGFNLHINRPLTPQQPSWQGPPPPGVDAILTRDVALAKEFRDAHVNWATNFALLSSDYLAGIHQREASRITAQFAPLSWQHYKYCDMFYCDVGGDGVWIKKQDAGWPIELGWESKGNLRMLTIAKMPVLCPDVQSARILALACCPNPVDDLTWHSVW